MTPNSNRYSTAAKESRAWEAGEEGLRDDLKKSSLEKLEEIHMKSTSDKRMHNIKCQKMSHSPQTQQETGKGLGMNCPKVAIPKSMANGKLSDHSRRCGDSWGQGAFSTMHRCCRCNIVAFLKFLC